jgi:hypothetical protein
VSSFWRSVTLPSPRVTVPPGYAIAGLSSCLVAGDPSEPSTWVVDTPIGRLTVTATAAYLVDWGDRTGWEGPWRRAGRPWPACDIAHTWEDAGLVDITVRAEWTARWSLGTSEGTLGGLHTTATIRRFAVRQVVAVVDG